jgi:hypothetical protein
MNAGVALGLEPETLSLMLWLPPEALLVRVDAAAIRSERRAVLPEVSPAALSGYLNLSARAETVDGVDRTGLSLEPVVNVHGVVFESIARLTRENHQTTSQVGETRLVLEQTPYRWELGEVRDYPRAFQWPGTFLGAGVSSGTSRSGQIAINSAEQTFTVERPVSAEVFLDGHASSQQRLEPGVYRMSEYGITPGSFDSRLVLTDDTGQATSIEAPTTYALSRDVRQWAMTAGWRDRILTGGGRELERPTFTGFYRGGLGDGWEAGANAQFDARTCQSGVEVTKEWEPGPRQRFWVQNQSAWATGPTTGTASSLNLGWKREVGRAQVSVGANLNVLSPGFPDNPVADSTPDVEERRTRASVFAGCNWRPWTAAVSASWDSTTPKTLWRFSVSRNAANWSVGAITQQTAKRTEAFLTVRWRPQRSRQRWSTTTSIGTTTSTNFTYDQVGDRTRFGGTVTAQLRPDRALIGNAYYDSDHFALAVVRQTVDAEKYSAGTSVSFNTALAWADGEWGLAPAISDGFTLVKVHPAWVQEGSVLGVNRWGHGYQAQAAAANAVIPQWESSRGSIVTVEPVEGGLTPDTNQYRTTNTYRRGTRIVIGTADALTVTGQITGPDGVPVPSCMIRLVRHEGGSYPAFTNADGRFSSDSIAPGSYHIELEPNDFADQRASWVTGSFVVERSEVLAPLVAVPKR